MFNLYILILVLQPHIWGVLELIRGLKLMDIVSWDVTDLSKSERGFLKLEKWPTRCQSSSYKSSCQKGHSSSCTVVCRRRSH